MKIHFLPFVHPCIAIYLTMSIIQLPYMPAQSCKIAPSAKARTWDTIMYVHDLPTQRKSAIEFNPQNALTIYQGKYFSRIRFE